MINYKRQFKRDIEKIKELNHDGWGGQYTYAISKGIIDRAEALIDLILSFRSDYIKYLAIYPNAHGTINIDFISPHSHNEEDVLSFEVGNKTITFQVFQGENVLFEYSKLPFLDDKNCKIIDLPIEIKEAIEKFDCLIKIMDNQELYKKAEELKQMKQELAEAWLLRAKLLKINGQHGDELAECYVMAAEINPTFDNCLAEYRYFNSDKKQ